MKSIIICLLFLLLCTNCREEKKSNGKVIIAMLALRSSSQASSFPASQTTAELFSANINLTSDDSAEQGSMRSTSNVSANHLDRAISFTGDINSGTITLTDESFNCLFGGNVSFSGAQTFSSSTSEVFNRTSTITNGTRTITYNKCAVSSSTIINSGSLVLTQLSPDSGSTTLQTAIIAGTTTSGTLQRTLSNLKTSVKGTINVTITGRRGAGTSDMIIDQTATITNRVRNWNLTNSRVSAPNLISRSGTIVGSLTVGSTQYTINRSLDVNTE
jgi:hypothetical protein